MMKRLTFPAFVAIALLAGSAGAAETPVQEASVHFDRGVKLFEDGDFKLALVEFKRSYEAVPDFRTLFNIGQVHFQLGNFAEARRTLLRYMKEGGTRIPEQRRKDVERDLDALKIRTAYVTIVTNVAEADVAIDGEHIGRAPLGEKLLVNGGPHTITIAKQGFLSERRDIALAGLEERSLEIRLAPTPAPEVKVDSGLGPVWIGWAATAALAAGTVGTGVAWQSAKSDLADTKSRPTTRAELDQKAETVDTRRNIATALGAATLVTAAVTLYFTITRKPALSGGTTPALNTHHTQAAGMRVEMSPTGVVGVF
jgi:hypothetical protein